MGFELGVEIRKNRAFGNKKKWMMLEKKGKGSFVNK